MFLAELITVSVTYEWLPNPNESNTLNAGAPIVTLADPALLYNNFPAFQWSSASGQASVLPEGWLYFDSTVISVDIIPNDTIPSPPPISYVPPYGTVFPYFSTFYLAYTYSGSAPAGTNEYHASGPPPPPPPPNANNVSIADAAPIKEGNSGSVTSINFILTLDQPASTDITVNVAFQTGQPLKYVNAVAGVDWITKIVNGLPLTELNTAVTFHQGQTQATCTVQAVGDDLIEPNEFLTATIVSVSGDPTIGISRTNGSATATILNDDGDLRDDVKVNGLSVIDPQLANLLTQDIQAAVARIEQALDNRVPPLKIDVVFDPTKIQNDFAGTPPVCSNSIVLADGTKIQLPNALYKKLFPSKGDPPAADMTLYLDLNKVIDFYSVSRIPRTSTAVLM